MRRATRCAAVCCLITFFAACSGDDPSAPRVGPPSFAGQGAASGRTSLDLIEQDYANGLLDRNNANRYRQYAVSAAERLPARYRSNAIGKDATSSMLRMALEWNQLARSTQQEILDLQASGFGQLKHTLETEHFGLHYATDGAHAVPAVDANGNGVSDFIDLAAESYERVWRREIVELGYPAPKGTPAAKFHVYFQNLKSYYGYTAALQPIETIATSPFPLGTAGAYVVIENDFAEGFPRNDEEVTGAEAVRGGAQKVTNAHEFMHASQFNINIYQSGWLFESHATWAEDAVYGGEMSAHHYFREFSYCDSGMIPWLLVAERIRIGGRPLDLGTLAAGCLVLQDVVPRVDATLGEQVTFFEAVTGLALLTFADAAMDVAVVEAGIGGAGDATAVLGSDLVVVTPVENDGVPDVEGDQLAHGYS